MKIYINNINYNKDNFISDNYLKKNLEYKKSDKFYNIIYSDEGIYKIDKKNIYKINVSDHPINTLKIKDYNLLVDKSKIEYRPNISTIPFNHKFYEINETIYKISNLSKISFVILKKDNNVFDYYFDVNSDNIDNMLKENIEEYINTFI
jgi:hypothetical protein